MTPKAAKPILIVGGGLFIVGLFRIGLDVALPKAQRPNQPEQAALQLPPWLTEQFQEAKAEAVDEAVTETTETLLNANSPDRLSVKFNAQLDQAIESARADVVDERACARAAQYLNTAYAQHQANGVGVEWWLLNQLETNTEDGKALVRQFTTIDGSAAQQDAVRPNSDDRLAILQALQYLTQGTTPNCRVNIADSIRTVEGFHYTALERYGNQFDVATEGTEPPAANLEPLGGDTNGDS